MKKSQILNKVNLKIKEGVAHRGLHNEQLTENGLGAFKNAIDNNIAFELDVHLTKDKQIVVCHDSSLKRTTNKEGVIEELTLKEIKDNYRLLNGESVPTLEEVLLLTNEKVPIVVELKPLTEKHNYKELAKITLSILNKYIKDKRNIILISFYPQSLYFCRNSGYVRCLLVDEKNKWTFILRHLFEGVDLEWTLLLKNKFAKVFKKKLTMCWTIEKEEQLNQIKEKCDSVTFQYLEPSLLKK